MPGVPVGVRTSAGRRARRRRLVRVPWGRFGIDRMQRDPVTCRGWSWATLIIDQGINCQPVPKGGLAARATADADRRARPRIGCLPVTSNGMVEGEPRFAPVVPQYGNRPRPQRADARQATFEPSRDAGSNPAGSNTRSSGNAQALISRRRVAEARSVARAPVGSQPAGDNLLAVVPPSAPGLGSPAGNLTTARVCGNEHN